MYILQYRKQLYRAICSFGLLTSTLYLNDISSVFANAKDCTRIVTDSVTNNVHDQIKNFIKKFNIEINDKTFDSHTINRHVGKSKDYLEGRLTCKDMKFVSSYTDVETANNAIKEAMQYNIEKIKIWLNDDRKKAKISFSKKFDNKIGISLAKNMTVPVEAKIAVVVLKRSEDDSFYVLTSYPVSSEKRDRKH